MTTSTFIPASPEKVVSAQAEQLPDLYTQLYRVALKWVRSSGISHWRGQECDVAEDIAQEGLVRYYLRLRQVECGQYPPIKSPGALATRIAWCHYADLVRREKRLVAMSKVIGDEEQLGEGVPIALGADELATSIDNVTEKVFEAYLFQRVAVAITRLPPKQRVALLVDLANRMSFDQHPTPLQQALRNVGICLQDYQKPLPADRVLRSRHAASLVIAYKRLKDDHAIQACLVP